MGECTASLGGVTTSIVVTRDQLDGWIKLSSANQGIAVSPMTPEGRKLSLSSDGTAMLDAGGDVASWGPGFVPGSAVEFHLLSGTSATYLGSLDVFSDGTYKGTVPIPSGQAPGTYTLQVNGWTADTRLRAKETMVLSLSILANISNPNANPGVKGKTARGIVSFNAYSAKLTKSVARRLDAVIKRIPNKSNNLVRVIGVVERGSGARANALAKARTKSVARYLLSQGVSGKYVLKTVTNTSGKGSSGKRTKVRIIPNRGT